MGLALSNFISYRSNEELFFKVYWIFILHARKSRKNSQESVKTRGKRQVIGKKQASG